MRSWDVGSGMGHLIAFAFAWLLLLPPQAVRSGTALVGPNLSAPLSEWQATEASEGLGSGSFATQAECDGYRAKMIADAKDRLLVGAPPHVESLPSETSTVPFTIGLAALSSECISADDLRLKTKPPSSRP
jgi:hypothetical protein